MLLRKQISRTEGYRKYMMLNLTPDFRACSVFCHSSLINIQVNWGKSLETKKKNFLFTHLVENSGRLLLTIVVRIIQ
jgi:hypothetical protein